MAAQYDAIVIGLGAAGCTAASTLAQGGKRVLALEAQCRIGGRVMSIPFGNGTVELGAEWIHGTGRSRIYELAVRNNVNILPQESTFELFRSDGSIADRKLANELLDCCWTAIDHPPKEPAPLGEFITMKLNEYIKEKHPELLKDKEFINEFINFMDLIVNNYESSNSWNDVSTETQYEMLEGDQHMSWNIQGFTTLFDILLNRHNGGPGYPNLEIKLNSAVAKIAWPEDPVENVMITCADGATYTADAVIVTVSIGVLKDCHTTLFSPQLPEQKVKSIEHISIGVVNKIIVKFNNIWWPKNPMFFGFLWSAEEKRKLAKDEIWLANIFGVSSPMGSQNALTLWTSGDDAKFVEVLSDDEVQPKIMKLLRMFMGANTTIPEPTGIKRSFWYANLFTRGSYSYDNIRTPQYPDARVDLAQPVADAAGRPRVLFAGEASNRTHFSTVHGAAETGFREAMRLLPPSKI